MSPSKLTNTLKELANRRFDHREYGIQPDTPPQAQFLTVCDELQFSIMRGSVLVRPGIKEVTPSAVVYTNGRSDNVDVILNATGYTINFPFLDRKIMDMQGNSSNLYKLVFPLEVSPATIALVGHVTANAPVLNMIEMQCRWIAQVFKVRF